MKPRISKAILIIFVVVGVGFSIYIIARAIVGGATVTALKRSPYPSLLIPRAYPDYHLQRSRMLMTKIESYKRRLDSLSKTDPAKYQEVLKANPQVLENIHSIETLFNALIKK